MTTHDWVMCRGGVSCHRLCKQSRAIHGTQEGKAQHPPSRRAGRQLKRWVLIYLCGNRFEGQLRFKCHAMFISCGSRHFWNWEGQRADENMLGDSVGRAFHGLEIHRFIRCNWAVAVVYLCGGECSRN